MIFSEAVFLKRNFYSHKTNLIAYKKKGILYEKRQNNNDQKDARVIYKGDKRGFGQTNINLTIKRHILFKLIQNFERASS